MSNEFHKPAPKPAPPNLANHLAREIDKRRLSPAVVAAGMGNMLTLLGEVLQDHEARIHKLEAHRQLDAELIYLQGERITQLRRQILALDKPATDQISAGASA